MIIVINYFILLFLMCIKWFAGESISVETIKHSFFVFEKFNCLTITTKDNVKMLSMNITEFNDQIKNMINMLDYIETLVKQIN